MEHPPIEIVTKFVGVPFRWGGTDLKGTDCIGIVVMFLQECSVQVTGADGMVYSRGWWKRDPQWFIREILERGTEVRQDQLRTFDVLCFRIEGEIRHIGVYVGYGKFLHAYCDASCIDRLSGSWGSKLALCVRPTYLVKSVTERPIPSTV